MAAVVWGPVETFPGELRAGKWRWGVLPGQPVLLPRNALFTCGLESRVRPGLGCWRAMNHCNFGRWHPREVTEGRGL